MGLLGMVSITLTAGLQRIRRTFEERGDMRADSVIAARVVANVVEVVYCRSKPCEQR